MAASETGLEHPSDERLQAQVMAAIANDYENLDMVVFEVRRWCAEDATEFDESLVPGILLRLVFSGLAEALDSSVRAESDPPDPPSLEDASCYFKLTSRLSQSLDYLDPVLGIGVRPAERLG